MAVNKVEYGGKTLIDLTEDSVAPEKLAQGETAHNRAGEQIVGILPIIDPNDKLDSNGWSTNGNGNGWEYLSTYSDDGDPISEAEITKDRIRIGEEDDPNEHTVITKNGMSVYGEDGATTISPSGVHTKNADLTDGYATVTNPETYFTAKYTGDKILLRNDNGIIAELNIPFANGTIATVEDLDSSISSVATSPLADTYYIDRSKLEKVDGIEDHYKLTADLIEFYTRFMSGERVFLKVLLDDVGWCDTVVDEDIDIVGRLCIYRRYLSVLDIGNQSRVWIGDMGHGNYGWTVSISENPLNDGLVTASILNIRLAEYGTPEEISAIFEGIQSQIDDIKTTLSNLGIAEEGSY